MTIEFVNIINREYTFERYLVFDNMEWNFSFLVLDVLRDHYTNININKTTYYVL